VAADWYLWQLGTLDIRYVGIAAWNPEGFHDIEWRTGSNIATRVYRRSINPNEDLLYTFAGNGIDPSEPGIVTINDDSTKHQTIGITDDIVPPPDTLASENEMVISTSLLPWVSDRLYMAGWITGHDSKVWRALVANTNSEPDAINTDWTDVTDEGLVVIHIPKGRIYTPDSNYAIAGVNNAATPVAIPAGQNYNFKGVGVTITSDGVTSDVTFKGGVTVINEIDIFNTTIIENVIYFNTFNQTIIIKIGDEIFIFYADCCEGRKWYCMSKSAVQNCYNLTPTEYAQMLIAGFTKVSGPHDTKLECVTSCDAVPKYWWCLELAAVQDCYELSEAELLVAIEDDGYVPISGPYLSEADCLVLCDSSTFTCDGISNPVAYAFTADDACLDGLAGTMTQGFGFIWSNLNVPSPCATDTGLLFDCDGDVPTASYNNCALTLTAATATSATFTGTGCAPITGDFTVVFTW
jgi:hypothetical protein